MKKVQHTDLTVLVFLYVLGWVIEGVNCLAVPFVRVESWATAPGFTPTAVLVTSGVVRGKTFLLRGDVKLLDSFDLLHGGSNLLCETLTKQHRRGVGEVLAVICNKPQRRI